MPEFDDLIAKYILAATLDEQGLVQPEKEIPLLSPQSADFYFEPGPGPRNPALVFRWVNFITALPCLVEMYSGTPTGVVILRGPLRKQLEMFQNRCLEAEHRKEPLPAVQPQWILSSGRPEQVFTKMGCRPIPGTPRGFYQILVDLLQLHVVVLSELPRQRDTLLLRMLGSRQLRHEALAEVRQIPADDPDGAALISILKYVQAIIERDPRIPQTEKEEFMLAMRQEFEKFKQGLRNEGKTEFVIALIKERGFPISDEMRQRILHCADPALLELWLKRALVAKSADEILRPTG